MGEFDRQFSISASKNPDILDAGIMDLLTDVDPAKAKLVQSMKADLDARHITVDQSRGPINKDGALSLIFASSDIPSVVVRIGQMDNPADSAIVLKSAARFVYTGGEGKDAIQYQAHVLPFAPDIGEVSDRDVINTIRVLKAEGLENRIFDISNGQFVYLRGGDGDFLRYPADCGDKDMAGQPIAFIRDLNCTQSDPEIAEKMAGTGTANDYLAKYGNGQTLAELPPAPASCVEACHQQDAIAENARRQLAARGVRLEGPVLS
jgi:hypothetical protein